MSEKECEWNERIKRDTRTGKRSGYVGRKDDERELMRSFCTSMSEGPSLALSNALSQMISIRKDGSFRIHDARSRREQKKKEDEEEEEERRESCTFD